MTIKEDKQLLFDVMVDAWSKEALAEEVLDHWSRKTIKKEANMLRNAH